MMGNDWWKWVLNLPLWRACTVGADDLVQQLGRPADVWELGCILYQLVYGQQPFAHIRDLASKMVAIQNPLHKINYPAYSVPKGPRGEELTDLKTKVGPDLLETMRSCLKFYPKERATIPELLQQPFLRRSGDEEPTCECTGTTFAFAKIGLSWPYRFSRLFNFVESSWLNNSQRIRNGDLDSTDSFHARWTISNGPLAEKSKRERWSRQSRLNLPLCRYPHSICVLTEQLPSLSSLFRVETDGRIKSSQIFIISSQLSCFNDHSIPATRSLFTIQKRLSEPSLHILFYLINSFSLFSPRFFFFFLLFPAFSFSIFFLSLSRFSIIFPAPCLLIAHSHLRSYILSSFVAFQAWLFR